tara:strand:- start:764 stop:1003 length:240 start_codon:yes stop_codon:yes gene_type:complete
MPFLCFNTPFSKEDIPANNTALLAKILPCPNRRTSLGDNPNLFNFVFAAFDWSLLFSFICSFISDNISAFFLIASLSTV